MGKQKKHDLLLHIEAGGLGVCVEGCPACPKWQPCASTEAHGGHRWQAYWCVGIRAHPNTMIGQVSGRPGVDHAPPRPHESPGSV